MSQDRTVGPTAGAWTPGSRGREGRVHPLTGQVADEDVARGVERHREGRRRAARDVLDLVDERDALTLFVDVTVLIGWERVRSEVGLEDDELMRLRGGVSTSNVSSPAEALDSAGSTLKSDSVTPIPPSSLLHAGMTSAAAAASTSRRLIIGGPPQNDILL